MLLFYSCAGMRNSDKPVPDDANAGCYFQNRDGLKLFVYDFKSNENYKSTIFIISGITGSNHNQERDLIEVLSYNENRIVVIHPRGTGYSDGERGDISDFNDLIGDYIEIITKDSDYCSMQHKIYLYGHSMATAILLAAADSLRNISGVILVNPPYLQKKVKGMSPTITEYISYAGYYLFSIHTPVVNMAGDPSRIEDEEDKKESEARIKDPLLVK